MDANLVRVSALGFGTLALSVVGIVFVRTANVGRLRTLLPGPGASYVLRRLAAIAASFSAVYVLYTITHDLSAANVVAAVTGTLCGAFLVRGSVSSALDEQLMRRSTLTLGACWIPQIFLATSLYFELRTRDGVLGLSSPLPMLVFSIFLFAPRIATLFRPARIRRQDAQ